MNEAAAFDGVDSGQAEVMRNGRDRELTVWVRKNGDLESETVTLTTEQASLIARSLRAGHGASADPEGVLVRAHVLYPVTGGNQDMRVGVQVGRVLVELPYWMRGAFAAALDGGEG